MKEITLKFREVAVDGLPEKSCKVLTLSGYAREDRVYANINDVSYSTDMEHLKRDIDRTKAKYNEIARKLSEIRSKLITLRNDKEELLLHLSSLSKLTKDNDKQIQSLNDQICPLCSSHLDNPLNLRIKRYNTGDDIILLSGELQIDIQRIEKDIEQKEAEYSEWLRKLNEYESALNLQSSEINDVLRHKGYIDITGRVENLYNISDVDFSAKHGKFNAYDTIEEDPKSVFSDDVLFWCPVSEVDAILKEDAQDVQTLD